MNIRKKAVALLLSAAMVVGTMGTIGAAADTIVPKFEVNQDGVLVHYNGTETNVTIPAVVDNIKITSIGEGAFTGGNITSVIIPDGVTSIGQSAFQMCSELHSVTIPASVKKIGVVAFNGCSLSNITIPDGVVTIEPDAFLYSTDPSKNFTISIPASVTSIGDGAFAGNSSIKSFQTVEDNQNYTTSNDGILFNKNKTELVQYPAGKAETNFVIPSGVTKICGKAFCDAALSSVVIPEGVTEIGEWAFTECRLSNVTIPGTVTKIGESAFSNNDLLVAITVSNQNQNYTATDGILFNKDGASLIQYPAGKKELSYSIPNTVRNVENYSFEGCENLQSVTIPSSILTIQDGAFEACHALTNVTISDGVTAINTLAFANCRSLTSLAIPGSVTSIGPSAFVGCTNLKKIQIPDSVKTFGYNTHDYVNKNIFQNCKKVVIYCSQNSSAAKYAAACRIKTAPFDSYTSESSGGSYSSAQDTEDALNTLNNVTTPAAAQIQTVADKVKNLSRDDFDTFLKKYPDQLKTLAEKLNGAYPKSIEKSPLSIDNSVTNNKMTLAPDVVGLQYAACESSQAPNDSDAATTAVTLSVKQIPADNNGICEFNFTCKIGETEIHALATPVLVTVHLPKNFDFSQKYAIRHTRSDGNVETIQPYKVDQTTNTMTFLTSSFSSFEIVPNKSGSGVSSDSGSGSGWENGSGSGSGNNSITPVPSPGTFVSDTNSALSVNNAYTFKITSMDGKAPTFVVGTPGIFTVQLVKQSGNDYFYKITAIGPVGAQAGVYVNGEKLLVATVKSSVRTFASDTNSNLSVNSAYTFKITSKNGKAPNFVVGTPGTFDVKLVKHVGNDYYIKITAVGAPGMQAGVYINGGSPFLVATVGSNPSYVKSDTTGSFQVKAGKSYVFKLTGNAKPSFVVGTGSAFKVSFVKQSGKDYFFRVTAVGKAGLTSGFYINHQGRAAVATIS